MTNFSGIVNAGACTVQHQQTCTTCNGTGKIEIWGNSQGDIDWKGRPTGEVTECDTCLGEGIRI